MPTPPRPDWITAVSNSMLSPEGVPVAAPDWFTTGRLGPSSMAVPYLSNRCRQHRATPLDRRSTVPSSLAVIAPLINRGEECDAEEQRNESWYAGGLLLSLKTMRHVDTLFDGHQAPRWTSRRSSHPNGIPVGSRRRRSNDKPAPAVETDAGPWSGNDPADYHWNAQPQANAAPRAAAQDVGILRVL
jgi:hypothetical protein